MKVQGIILSIRDTETVSDKFKKRDLWIEIPGEYPQTLSIQFTQDRCDVLNGYEKGQDVEIDINLKGRGWTNPEGEKKVFNTIEGWKINKVGGEVAAQKTQPKQEVVEEEDDLPF